MQGGGDSDTVSAISQPQSVKLEPEVTGPHDVAVKVDAPDSEAPDSEAARVRKVCTSPYTV